MGLNIRLFSDLAKDAVLAILGGLLGWVLIPLFGTLCLWLFYGQQGDPISSSIVGMFSSIIFFAVIFLSTFGSKFRYWWVGLIYGVILAFVIFRFNLGVRFIFIHIISGVVAFIVGLYIRKFITYSSKNIRLKKFVYSFLILFFLFLFAFVVQAILDGGY